jgi:hypothetical protein
MGDVVDLRPKGGDADGPHLAGEAVCGACGREWVAVAPAGTIALECPGCGRLWGALKHIIEPRITWRCRPCGEQLFWLTPDGAVCRRCGVVQTEWAE